MPRLKKDYSEFGPEWSGTGDLCAQIDHITKSHRGFARGPKLRWFQQTLGKAARACRRGDHYGTVFYLMAAGAENTRAWRERSKRSS